MSDFSGEDYHDCLDDYETFEEWQGNFINDGKASWGGGNCWSYCESGRCDGGDMFGGPGCTFQHPTVVIGTDGRVTLSRDVPRWTQTLKQSGFQAVGSLEWLHPMISSGGASSSSVARPSAETPAMQVYEKLKPVFNLEHLRASGVADVRAKLQRDLADEARQEAEAEAAADEFGALICEECNGIEEDEDDPEAPWPDGVCTCVLCRS